MAWRSSGQAPVGAVGWGRVGKPVPRLLVCVAAVLAVTAVLYLVPLDRRPLTSALTFLFVVLIISATWGLNYSLFVSLLAALAFSWLLSPVGRFWLSDPRDVFTLAAFLVIGITTSHLSDRARREALNANERSAEALAANRRSQDLVNSIEGIVWEADAETFVFSFVSEHAERILGYSPEQWLREPAFWKNHLHPEDRDSAVRFWVRAATQKRSHDFEYRMIAADGRVVWLRDLITVVAESGRATRLRGVMIDITRRRQNEATLREQANLLSLTHDAILVRDNGAAITFWNRAAEEMYGWTAEEALGAISHQLLKTVFLAPLEQIEAELMRTGRWEGELVHTRKDGAPLVVASRWSLQQNTQGAPVAILEINSDITAQKRAEQARHEIEEQWKAAFESNPTMYFIIDAAGTIVSVNTFGAEELGYTVSELVGQPVLNVFYEPDRHAVQGYATSCLEQPGRMMRWEARKIRRDGSMLWVRETANAVLLKKHPVLLVVCQNITEQKRAEDAARRSESELRNVIETIPAMAFAIRPDGTTDFVNRRVLEYTGLSQETISGPGWQSTVHAADFERHMNQWRASMASGQPFENEVRHRNANGEYRWFLVRAVPLRGEHGNILKWYGILTDIEDRKQAESLLTGEKLILEMVAKGDSLAQILDTLCRLVEQQAPGVLASILLFDGDRLRHGGAPSLPTPYTDAIDGAPVGPSAGSCGTAAFRGEQVIVEDIALDPLWADYRDLALPHSLRACWSTPIFSSQRKVIATFAMYYRQPCRPSLRDQEIIEQITHLAGVAIERKVTQEALRRNQAYLAESQRLTRTGSWAFNPFTEQTIYWSEEMFRIFGLDSRQGPPSSEAFWERVHPEDRDAMDKLVRKAVLEKTEYDHDHRIVLPDGTVKHIHALGHPLLDAAGEILEYIGTSMDVTERKRAEEGLRRSEAYLEESQRLTKTGSWAYNPATERAIYWSDEMFRIFGLDPQTKNLPDRKHFNRLMHPEDRDAFNQNVAKAFQEKTEFVQDYRIVLPDGAVKHLHEIGHPVLDEAGNIIEYLGTEVDVTDRKRAEAERERLRQLETDLSQMNRISMMGELAASLAHEIKQPIAAAATNARTCQRWLQREPSDIAEAREALSRIVKDVNRAADIIDRNRALYTRDAPKRETVDLNELIREMVGLLHDKAYQHSIPIRTELQPDLAKITADRVQLQQVLLNLMLNGIEAMKDSRGELIVTSAKTADEQLLVSVSDSGIGLPVRTPELIFEPFFTTKAQGTGMGLSISRRIIEAHGGRLWASGSKGGGATFHFTLPPEVKASSTSAG